MVMNTLPSLAEWLAALTVSERQTLASLWHLPDSVAIAPSLTMPAVIERLLAELRPYDRAALERVLAERGQIPTAMLEREFGIIRPHVGFVNPRAYLNALQGVPSAVERLWVLGLLQRVRSDAGVFYAIPAELFPLLPEVAPIDRTPLLRPADLPRHQQRADPFRWERDLVALLALAYVEPLMLNNNGTLHRTTLTRLAERLNAMGATSEARWPEAALLRILSRDLGLLHDRGGTLRVASGALEWLGQAPAERFASMFNTWLDSHFDELTGLCGVRWRTPPLYHPRRAARRAVLDLLRAAPEGWITLETFSAELQRINPDFMRTGADYETWQLTNADGALLTGWANWQHVEGSLSRAYLAGPLHWLGLLDVGGDHDPTHVRLASWGAALLGLSDAPAVFEAPLSITSDGTIEVSTAVPPLPRFQIGRIAAWQRVDACETECYAITSRSFDEAIERGIGRQQMLEFLTRWSATAPEQTLSNQLGEWEQRRTALRAEPVVLLQAQEPALLAEIAQDRRVRLPAYQVINPATWAIEPADSARFIASLREQGYGLSAAFADPELPLSERDLRTLFIAALVATALSSTQGLDHGITAALLERVRRLLPSATRAEAERTAQDLIQGILRPE